jgi:hypothetical protein
VEYNGKAFCQEDYEKLTQTSCFMCRGVIQDESIHACGQIWHRECFGCMTCQRYLSSPLTPSPFPDKKFFIHENLPYCLDHYYQAANTLCGGCRRPIQGNCVDVQELGSRFHQDCWRCISCNETLTDVYYSFQGRSYCEVDIDEVFSRGGGRGKRPEKRHTMTMRGQGRYVQ